MLYLLLLDLWDYEFRGFGWGFSSLDLSVGGELCGLDEDVDGGGRGGWIVGTS